VWALRNGAIPAGRIISNAGAQEHKPATSTINCTVSGTIEDSMLDILEKNLEAGLTLKAGCGIGYEFSTLRPKGGYVSGAGAYTSGPLSFMDIFDKMCFTVSSAGGRRGAQMGTFDISHPDVVEFIRAKRETAACASSTCRCWLPRSSWRRWRATRTGPCPSPISPRKSRRRLDIGNSEEVIWRISPRPGLRQRRRGAGRLPRLQDVKARKLWNVIMTSTYDFAEPGFILIDKVNEMNNNWFCENIRATNPCGEQPLPPYGSLPARLDQPDPLRAVDPFREKRPLRLDHSARWWRCSRACSTTWWR
jgi:ribonucleoside-diphosphate reductase alpha chain